MTLVASIRAKYIRLDIIEIRRTEFMDPVFEKVARDTFVPSKTNVLGINATNILKAGSWSEQ